MSVTVPAVMVVFCRLRMAAAVTAELPASTVMVPPALAMVEVCSMVSVAPACTVMAPELVTVSACSALVPAVTVSAPVLARLPLRMTFEP